MNLKVISGSQIPIYEQLYNQIRDLIIKQVLLAQEQLPSIRGLAKDTQVSVITIKKAYEDLERDGYIYAIPSKGYYVQEQDQQAIETFYYDNMDHHIREIKSIATALDLNYETLLTYLKTKL